MILLQQMVILFVFMLLGFMMAKKKVINEMVSKSLSFIVVNIANPALILTGSMSQQESLNAMQLIKIFGLALLIFAGLILVSVLLPVLLKIEPKSRGVYKVMLIFSNIGFMGFPLIRAMYGESAILYASPFLIPFNLLIYTYGIGAMQPGHVSANDENKACKHQENEACKHQENKACKHQENEKDTDQKMAPLWKKILNIGVISCIITFIIAIFHIQVPTVIKDTASALSALTAPLSMMVIGASMADIKIRELFCDIRLLVFSVIKMMIIPVAGLLLLKCFIYDQILLGVCMVMLATPVASMSAMLAQQYDGDYELASRGVALTTLISVFTMPLVSILTGI